MNAGGVLNTCKSSGEIGRNPFGEEFLVLSGGRVRNTWVTCPYHRDNTLKSVLIPDNINLWHHKMIKALADKDGPASD